MESSSIDKSEIDHFSSRASVWWDPNGPTKLLHKNCPAIRIPMIVEGLKKLGKTIEGLKFFDVGEKNFEIFI